MTKYSVIRKIKKQRKNRIRIEKVGTLITITGLSTALLCVGEGNLSALHTLICGLSGCLVAFIGLFIVGLVRKLNKDFPLRYILVDKGSDLWYDMYISEKLGVISK